MSHEVETALEKFIDVYQRIDKHNLELLNDIYHQDVIFEDPAHRIVGLASLSHYFINLYQHVTECRFYIAQSATSPTHAFVTWRMQLSHPKLANGSTREILGCSCLQFIDGKVSYQRDYFDLGDMLYEALPVLGSIIRQIKKRLGQ